jgi:hypothetical protein
MPKTKLIMICLMENFHRKNKDKEKLCVVHEPVLRIRIRDPDPGSGAFVTPGSGIWNRFFPDPGSQTHIVESLVTHFRVKSSIIL